MVVPFDDQNRHSLSVFVDFEPNKTSEFGVLTALAERLSNRRLPKLMAMKEIADEALEIEKGT